MSRYDPLRDFLRQQSASEFYMRFSEVEALVGPLPKSAERPQWWANTTTVWTNVQRRAWLDGGYDAFLVSGSSKVRFVRTVPVTPSVRLPTAVSKAEAAPATRPPLSIQALLADGFCVSSRWILGAGGELVAETALPREPGVYVFGLAGRAVYVGIASTSLAKRLYFYSRPGVSQRTNIRLNARLRAELATAGSIDILTASPPAMSWRSWPINTAAGLEYGLISSFDIPWNLRGI